MNELRTEGSQQEISHVPTCVGLSIVVPAFNEEVLLRGVVQHLLQTAPRWAQDVEIIIVNDGSKDATGKIADELADQNDIVSVVHRHPNRGFGATLRAGCERATKQYVMYCPADYEFTNKEFDIYTVLIKYTDIVIGYRRERRNQLRLYQWSVSAVYHLLVSVLFRLNFYDVNWIHMYRRDTIKQFMGSSDGPFLLAENLIRAKRKGLQIVGVDVEYIEREAGKATGAQPKTIFRTLRDLVLFYLRGLKQ